MATLSHDDYHIGIICALPKERTAVEAMLDEKHSRLKNKHLDNNTYSYGRIDEHNVVIASLGKGKYGTVSAANVAADIRRSFPSMRYGFMVGIAGGMPHVERAEETEREAEQDVHERKPKAKRQEGDIRLGDIVVGAVQGVPSVINYGLGKEDIDGGFDIRSQLAEPPAAITTAIAALEADHVREGPTYLHHLEKLLSNDRYNTPEVEDDYYDMPESPDQLFEADPNTGQERLVKRPVRFLRRPPSDLNLERRMNFIRARDGKFFDYPKVHYGSIASADRLIKNRKARDLWYDRIKEQTKAKVLCFEMEASGIVKGWPCLVVRGICDYCDSHKNDDWQNFAAAVAAAYTKDLLCRIAPSEIVRAKPANEVISQTINYTFCIGVFHIGDEASDEREILTWLKPDGIDIQTSRLDKLRNDWVKAKTGSWIQKDLFSPWLDSQQTRSLWLHGPGGCGKSVVCSMIVDGVQNHLGKRGEPPIGEYDAVLFVLFSFDDPSSQNMMFLLRSLLFQLSAYRSIPEEVMAMHQNNPIGPSEQGFRATLFAVLERMQRQRSAPYTTRTQSISMDKTTREPRSLTLAIDSIDELSSPDFQQEVLQLVEDLQTFSLSNPHFPVRIALSSRDHPDIRDICTSSPGWYITTTDTQNIRDDIATFVSNRMQNHLRMKKMPSERRSMICKKVIEASQDMFRLASLYMEELSSWNMKDIEDKFLDENLFSKLPKDLPKFYDYILDRVKPRRRRNDMFVILKWILIAARPLTVSEIKQACSITPDKPKEFDESSHVHDFLDFLVGLVITKPPPRQDVRSFNSSRVKAVLARTDTQTVAFEHFSVKEYLLTMTSRGWDITQPRYSLQESQLYAAQCCLTYLAHCSQQTLGRTQKWSFRAYAWHHWATHLAAMSTGELFNAEAYSALGSCLRQTQTNADSLSIQNEASFPFVRHHGKESLAKLHKSNLLRAGRVDSTLAFENKYSKILRDPEFPFDFLEEDLSDSSLRRPIYQVNGLPDAECEVQLNKYTITANQCYGHRTRDIRPRLVFPPLANCSQVIRLVALHPALDNHTDIICSVLTETLHNKPRYEALSYNWHYGRDRDEVVLVNGREFSIGANLASALRELRLSDRPRILWVDGLCIDMDNLTERGPQVRMMDKIYHEAERVVVWLGPKSRNSDYIMENIAFVGDPIAEIRPEDYALHVGLNRDPLYCMAELFAQPVWRKLWILLEAVLAAEITIAWGGERLSWQALERCDDTSRCSSREHTVDNRLPTPAAFEIARGDAREIMETPRAAQTPHVTLETYRQLRRNLKKGIYLSFPQLLFKTRHLEVSFSTDKIMVLLHLLSPEEKEHVLPFVDYNMSNLDINVSVAEYCLRKLNNLDLLSVKNPRDWCSEKTHPGQYYPVHPYKGIRAIDESSLELPSWAPAWHCEHWTVPLIATSFDPDQPRRYTAGGPPYPSCFTLANRTLYVQGITVGTILHVPPHYSERLPSDTLIENPRLLQEFFERYGSDWKSVYSAVQSTCSAGFDRINDAPLFGHAGMVDEDDRIRMLRSIEEKAGVWDVTKRYERQRVVCITDEGHLALVPSWSQEGDIIKVLLGGSVPYVIRATAEGQHSLVGDCYVHGIMHGELLMDSSDVHQVVLV